MKTNHNNEPFLHRRTKATKKIAREAIPRMLLFKTPKIMPLFKLQTLNSQATNLAACKKIKTRIETKKE